MSRARSLLAATLALLTPLILMAPAEASEATCRRITFIGVHGLSEGREYSETIQRTWLAYERWATDHGDADATSFTYVNYEKEDGPTFIRNGGRLIDTAVDALDGLFWQLREECESTLFVLAGYSLGAWAIDKFMAGRVNAAADRVAGIMLYGDPWWDDPSRGDRGLARLMYPADTGYPQFPAVTRTLCAERDPICGAGYGGNLPVQAITAGWPAGPTCGPDGIRPHLCYLTDAARQGGEFLAERALRRG